MPEKTIKHLCKIVIKDVRVHAPITCIKLGIPIYFIDHSEFITVQREKILSRANNNEMKCFESGSFKENINPIRPGLFSRSPGPGGGLRGPDAKNRG